MLLSGYVLRCWSEILFNDKEMLEKANEGYESRFDVTITIQIASNNCCNLLIIT